MEPEQPDPALRAANLALTGRRMERAASRFASIELRGIESKMGSSTSDRKHIAWEMAAMFSVGTAALFLVVALWFF